MGKLFLKGIVFGAGFCLSVLAIVQIFFLYIENTGSMSQYGTADQTQLEMDWHKLSQEEQINAANAFLIVRYRDGEEGQKLAFVSEVHRRSPNVAIEYQAGDLYPRMHYYPENEIDTRSGAVVFFAGTPSTYRHGLYLYDDRVTGYGGMPLRVLIKKLKENA